MPPHSSVPGPKHSVLPGPDLASPFSVLSGLVVVMGQICVNIPQGGTWPGMGNVPARVLDMLCPYETRSLPGTLTSSHVTPERLEAGTALVTAQLLSRGTAEDRLLALGTLCDPEALHHDTGASVIGVKTREQYTKALRVTRTATQQVLNLVRKAS